MPKIFIVTGEASGDLHGAHLAEALRALRPDVVLTGVGGERMAKAGVELLPGLERLDIVGMIGTAHVAAIARNYATITRYLREARLDAVVFIDHPGMNLRLARVAARAGHRIVYYIAPQVWAWGSGRLARIKRLVRRVIVILPFEQAIYRKAGVACDFVGHPLLDEVAPTYDAAALRKRFGLPDGAPVVGLLPGSRVGEVRMLLPLLLVAARSLAARHPGTAFVLAQAATIPDDVIRSLTVNARVPLTIIKDRANDVMAASDLLLVASGTATLQAAVLGTPMVMLYRVSWPTYWLGWLFIHLNRIRIFHHLGCLGLVNLVAGRRIVTELIQTAATPEALVAEAERIWPGSPGAQEMRKALRAVRASLGEPGASRRAAEAVLAECGA